MVGEIRVEECPATNKYTSVYLRTQTHKHARTDESRFAVVLCDCIHTHTHTHVLARLII